jgi:hypothetical protein
MSIQAEPTINDWIDEDFPNNVDFSQHPSDLADGVIQDDPILQPEVVQNTRPSLEEQEAPTPVATVEPEPEEPESFDLKGGGHGTIEKTKKGWCVSVDVGIGGVQNFYGKTKNEAMINMANSIASGTKKIRELNRQVKLGPVGENTPAPAAAPRTAGRKLTDDEIFELKTELASNPDQALDKWIEKKLGRKLEDVAEKADRGDRAARNLELESVHQEFRQLCPNFYGDEKYENYQAIVAYLAKNKLSRTLTEGNRETVIDDLLNRGQYTAENLEEAYTDLNDSGLLIQAPRVQAPAPVQQEVPAPTTGRIVRQETRPRAGLGIRSSEISSSTPPPTIKPLSDDDLEKLPTEEIDRRIAQIQREIRSRR